MNVDSSNCKVVSKYFISSSGMDESLEFQEKKSFKGPKNTKPTAAKPKVRKVKKIKGQKDIRTALKGKKSDLVAYSKDFDVVCKKSGIDIDSEQLQLAIALSKSLQPESDDGASTSSLTSQQRTGLIRSTLKEYGFKVPEVKLSNNNRKTKKRRKPYKLLITTDEEKQQIISDKYSQLLFEFNNPKPTSENLNVALSDLFIYNMSTNIEYKDIKDDEVFYVEDLIEKSPNTMGCLLRDWSNIPGRLQSPTQDKSEIIFSEIECSQDEIDIVLSGSLKNSKNILNKRNLYRKKSIDHSFINEDVDKGEKIDEVPKKNTCNPSPEIEIISSGENTSERKENVLEVIEVPDNQLLSVPQTCRSCSPDLFGDDDDDNEVTIVEMNNEAEPVPLVSTVMTETVNGMDLTECVKTALQKTTYYSINVQPLSLLSQETDRTKRKSNDFMEMTECVGSSQPILEKIDEHIDLTAEHIIVTQNNVNVDQVEHMDLTQSSNTSTDSLPFVFISGKEKDPVPNKSLNDTIILDEKDYEVAKSPDINNEEDIDIRHDIHDESQNHSLQNTNKVENKMHLKSPVKSLAEVQETSVICLDESCGVNIKQDSIDLTQTSDTKEQIDNPTTVVNVRVNNSSLGKKDDISVDYDEALENMNNSYCAYDYNIDEENNTEVENDLEKSKEDTNPKSVHSEVLELSDNEENIPNIVHRHFDLGGISVIDHMPSFNSKSRITMGNVPNGSLMSESFPTVYVKSVTSEEKAKPPFKDFLEPLNEKEIIINDEDKTEATEASKKSPVKTTEKRVNVETPKQTEYIVKTNNVTPMVDYAAMTSPERNRELDKYGLKPFKRKRAIQLLTHLYNQTHPYVESTEELPSPSKKRKCDNLSQPCTSKSQRETSKSPIKASKSPGKTSKSPRKTSKSPRRKSPRNRSPRKNLEDSGSSNVSDKENDMFMVTREIPVVRRLECDVEDWVFQKREKAKLHTCRVPLHIAFHNFVSCRKGLHEAILRYEPVRIDVIHKELAATGHRYDPKDLLKFMDKKCITVKTADSSKNKNRY